MQIAKRFLHPGDTLAVGGAKLPCAPQAQPLVPADALHASPTQAAAYASDAVAAEHTRDAMARAEACSPNIMQSQAELAAHPARATSTQGSQAEPAVAKAPDTLSHDTIARPQRFSSPRGGFVLAGEQAPGSRSMVADGEEPWGSEADPGRLQRDNENGHSGGTAVSEAQAAPGRAEESSGEPAAAAERVQARADRTPMSSAADYSASGAGDHAAPDLWLAGADELAVERAAGPATQSIAGERHVETYALAPLQDEFSGHSNRGAAERDKQLPTSPLSGADDVSVAQQAGNGAHGHTHAAQARLAHAASHESGPVPDAPQASEKARALILEAPEVLPLSAGRDPSPPQQPGSNRNSNATASMGAGVRREAGSRHGSLKDVKPVDLGSASRDGTTGAKLRNQANSARAGKPGKKRTFASMLKRK